MNGDPVLEIDEGWWGWIRSKIPPPGLRRRLLAIGALILVVEAGLGVRLWQLQVLRGEHYRELADHNRVRLRRLIPSRGLAFDRFGRVLVENRPSFDVVMVPEDARRPASVLAQLEELVDTDLPDARKSVALRGSRSPFEPVVLARDVERETLVQVETHRLELPGVSVHVGPRRSYLYGEELAHVLGYLGEVSPTDLRDREGYRMRDTIGRYGLEKQWEDWLRGSAGGQQVEVDAIGRELRVLHEVSSTPGANVFLTIDVDLQRAAFRALEGREGAIVAIDPRSGAIRALVSRPAFDPNRFSGGISQKEWSALVEDPLRPISDRALQGQYPPGSVFKIVTAAAALEEGVVTPFTKIFCGGRIKFGRRYFHCWRRAGHGWVDLHDAIVGSCDVYFYQVSQRLGVDTIADFARRFGFGSETGLAIDHENGGVVPDTGWKRRNFGEPWYPGETLSIAIGQGYITATPVQVASMMATVAGGGVRRRPYLVDRIETADGAVVRPSQFEEQSVGLRSSTLTQLQLALRDVVNAERGTGRNGRLENVEVAGKTGTSQTVRLRKDDAEPGEVPRAQRDHAWFAAYAPADDPEIAVAVLVEHAGGGGGAIAAPIARKVLERYFAIPPRSSGDEG